MSIDTLELTASETEALRRIEAGLHRRFGGVGLDERFDERVLARVREWDASQLAEKRAQAEQQYARWRESLARQWRSARHVLIANLAAFASVAFVTWVELRSALPQGLAGLAEDYLGRAALQLPWVPMIVAAATLAIGWGVSARVKL